MNYEAVRKSYRPADIQLLFIAESPPPADISKPTTRAFYLVEAAGDGDRLFNNTMQVLYPDFFDIKTENLAKDKPTWLKRFQADGFYLIEALTDSMPKDATPSQRQKSLKEQLPSLLERVKALVRPGTPIILIKSNPFKICTQPLRGAGYNVLNTETLNYPGYWQEQAYRTKLEQLLAQIKKEPR
jgi:hypothetical protein